MTMCRWLRWKGVHARDWQRPDDLQATLERWDVPFSCLRTTEPCGPDGDLVEPESCGAHRTCFEALAGPATKLS